MYETDPNVVSKLLNGGYTAFGRTNPVTGVQFPPAAGYIAPCWRKLLPEIAWTYPYRAGRGRATVFCHRMTSPGGHVRLVYIQFEDVSYPKEDDREARGLSFAVVVIQPGDWRTPPVGSPAALVGHHDRPSARRVPRLPRAG